MMTANAGLLEPRTTEVTRRGTSTAVLAPARELHRSDSLRPFQTLIIVVRWVCLSISALLIATTPVDRTSRHTTVFALLAGWTAFRTVRPIRNWGFHLGTAASVLVELAISISAVCLTGYWNSPLAFLILPGVLIGGFSQGGPLVVGYGTISSLLVTGVALLNGHHQSAADWRASGQWSIELMLVALVAGLGHRVLAETLESHSAALDSMEQLTTANSLLHSLHQVAQRLPESLDLDDVLRSTVDNAKQIIGADRNVVLLRDDSRNGWLVARASGARLPAIIEPDTIPAVELAARSTLPIRLCDVPEQDRHALTDDATSGVYAPLLARGTLIGVLVLEHEGPLLDETSNLEVVRRLAEPAAVAVDNARWFSRIGIVAADEERIRIARDLHDRVGQSLAYIGFELDRLAKNAADTALAPQVAQLRGDVRNVVSEVRETLYDLRTDVDGERGFVPTLEEFLERVRSRSSLTITFEHNVRGALPRRQERELWQIAKEAVVNAERHSGGTSLTVRWQTDGRFATLDVIDNGKGITSKGRSDSYGLRGLYERAAAIGARLEIVSESGQGTAVRCRLESL